MLKCVLGLLLTWTASVEANTCSYYDVFNDYETFSCPRYYDTYDEDYCCGTGSSQYCCDYDAYYDVEDSYVNVSGIVGGVISFFVFVAIIVAFSICCCMASCPLYQRRHRGRIMAGGRTAIVVSQTQHTNRVQQPHPPPGVTYPTHPQYRMAPGYHTAPYGGQPAPYGNNNYAVQPGYGGAYPPPPPNYNQAVGTANQSVTVTSTGAANPVYPPV